MQASIGGSAVKTLPDNAGDTRDVGSTPGSGKSPGEGNGNPLQCSCLDIPWTEEPSRLQSMGSQRVRHDRVHMPVDALSYPKDIKGNREMDSCPG